MAENEQILSVFGYLKKRYGEKVYKLPVNLPVTCPNRIQVEDVLFVRKMEPDSKQWNRVYR